MSACSAWIGVILPFLNICLENSWPWSSKLCLVPWERETETEKQRQRHRESETETEWDRQSVCVCGVCACARMCVCVCVWACKCACICMLQTGNLSNTCQKNAQHYNCSAYRPSWLQELFALEQNVTRHKHQHDCKTEKPTQAQTCSFLGLFLSWMMATGLASRLAMRCLPFERHVQEPL